MVKIVYDFGWVVMQRSHIHYKTSDSILSNVV
jgi:hypothetical protein